MFTELHHIFGAISGKTAQRRILAAIALVAVMVGIGSMVLTARIAVRGSWSTAVTTVRTLDQAGFGSVRTLLIASMEPELGSLNSPIESCSPFGSLTACASKSFAALSHLDVHAPI